MAPWSRLSYLSLDSNVITLESVRFWQLRNKSDISGKGCFYQELHKKTGATLMSPRATDISQTDIAPWAFHTTVQCDDICPSVVCLNDVLMYLIEWAWRWFSSTWCISHWPLTFQSVNLEKPAWLTWGEQVGHGQVQLVKAEVAAVLSCSAPNTPCEWRRVLVTVEYYICFCFY